MGGIFGADIRLQRETARLKRENADLLHQVAGLKEDVTQWKAYGQSLGSNGQMINLELKHLREQVQCLADSQERNFENMPTREEFDAAKQQLMQAVTDATNRVSTDLQALRDQIAQGNPVTDQDLADLQADIAAVGQIDPANPTPPASRRRP